MTFKCQARGLRLVLLIHVVICFHPNSTKGNSVTELEGPFGEFQSPGYPDLDDDMNCTWKITVQPQNKIILNFLEFDLEEVFFCKDEVQIFEGDVRKGTYSGTQLHQRSISSTTSTISVVLISCSTSLFFDRRGIRVSYSTVYPTTLAQETSNKVTSTIRILPSTKPIEDTVNGKFSSQIYPMLSKDEASTPTFLTSTELPPKLNSSGHNREQESSGNPVPLILAGLFVSIFILIIITIVIVKRRKAKLSSNASRTVSNENNEASYEQADLSTVVPEGIVGDNSYVEYGYVQGTSEPNASNEHVVLDQNCVVFSTKMSFPRLQTKHPVFDSKNDVCVYKNKANNVNKNTDFDQDYGTVGCPTQETSPELENSDRHLQSKDSGVNSNEGIVVNSAYEPYIPQT